MELWNKLVSIENIRNAWESVRAKGSCAGIDKVTVESYQKNYEINLQNLQLELLDNRYRVLPVMRIKLPFFESSDRPLAVPAVRDRIVMRALSNILVPIFENKFYDCNYSYRPHRSANQAANKVNDLIKSGVTYFFKSDIEKFFENIDHDLLMEKLKIYIEDEAVLNLIKKLIRAQVFDHTIVVESLEGLHQGSPLSPLLSNIYLMSFDEEITKKGYQMIRYCDDFLILSLFEKELDEIQLFASEVLSNLKLKLSNF
jgi:RNA-directed DNA polymerase